MPTPLNAELMARLANDPKGPVALHLHQELLPVEGRGAPFFPATFAMDSKYNIDELADGTKVALVDSVGSQANRMEPLFLEPEFAELVPQIDIRYGTEPHQKVSLLEAGHRLGDAVVRCTELADEANAAFLALDRGDATLAARLAPTSLLFGAWDSRDTGVKVPRIVQSTIRAWDVSRLTRSAQFNPALDYAAIQAMDPEDQMKKDEQKAWAERGYLHVPSTGDHGGIIAKGPIRRDVTLNLIALRRLKGRPEEDLRRYLLGLALIAAGEPMDPFLRQGCILVPDAEVPARWTLIERTGARDQVLWDSGAARQFAREAARGFGVQKGREVRFDAKRAKADVKGKKK
ncbi:MAG TPA: type I-U CRISPR-associated RAMP protein Csb1/Cas7u [Myxococcota bacterium]|nr:type I-U CRISPR-associated RAMP protein Csb1/Cas7u [Myxococcota bacterium]